MRHRITISTLTLRRISHRQRESEIRASLDGVLEPYTRKSIHSFVQTLKIAETSVFLELNLHVTGYPQAALQKVKDACRSEIKKVPWVTNATITLLTPEPRNGTNTVTTELRNVQHVIAVSSCKGGVGKSTVAANLALTLAQRGLRIGLLDADIYGPSLPLLISSDNAVVRRSSKNPNIIQPLIGPSNLKYLSFGHVNPRAGVAGAGGKEAAIIRGPIASRVINQLVAATEWGDLDYLVVDMPPGTGDIQITLAQTVPFTGAVIVTTPHSLSVADAAKGVAMFHELNIPTLALVENMAYFECRHGEKYFPFGRGGRDKLMRSLGFEKARVNNGSTSSGREKWLDRLQICPFHSFPLTEDISNDSDPTTTNVKLPVVAKDPGGNISTLFSNLADDIVVEVLKIVLAAELVPTLSFLPEKNAVLLRYFTATSASEYILPTIVLRQRDPVTGCFRKDPSLNESNLPTVLKFEIKGNYGVSMIWSDGHFADIFPFDVLKTIAEDWTTSARAQ